MFGIGLPEMIVIMAVALIVVGPEKLPDLARSVTKWVFELKKTVNQVKEGLADEENLINSVQSDIRKTSNELKEKFIESDHFTFHEPGGPRNIEQAEQGEVIDDDTSSADSEDQDEISADEPENKDQDSGDPESESKA